jgi:hypothetical protein
VAKGKEKEEILVQRVKAQGDLFVTITAMQGNVDNSSKSCALLWMLYFGT